jgi:predicted transcriptional regulator
MRDLTSTQRTVLDAFATFERVHGRAPTLRELLAAIGRPDGSTNGIMDHLRALERKGMMIGLAGIARGWTLTAAGRAELGIQRTCPKCGEVLE